MKAETVIHDRLSSFFGVTALIGAGAAARLYPVVVPPTPIYPLIAFRRVASRRLQGAHSDPGYAYVTVQITSMDKTALKALALAEQVRLALERYGSAITGVVVAGVTVYDITMGTEVSDYDSDVDVHMVATDFTILHGE